MSYSLHTPYGHVITNYGNYYDGTYYSSDGAYHSNSGYNDYLGDNYEDPPSNYQEDPEPYAGYREELHRRAAEHGLTPQELHELNIECVREQEEMERERIQEEEEAKAEIRERQWASEREQEEMEREQRSLRDWAEEYEEMHPGTPIQATYLEQEVYEAYGTADEPPDAATSLGHDAWPDVDTTPLEYEHLLLGYRIQSPDWELAATVDPAYNDEANAHGFMHAAYHTVEPHIDDTTPI